MTDSPRHTPFVPTDYLAGRDVLCHSCGYNLRGCREPQCPECGEVIPRPPAPHPQPQQALRCFACGYQLGAPNLRCCPECGSDDITLGVRSLKSRIPPFRWHRKALLLAVALIGSLVVLWVMSL